MILDFHETLEAEEEVPTLGVFLLSLALVFVAIVLGSTIFYLGCMALRVFI